MDDRALLDLLDRDPNAAMEALLVRYGPLLRYVVGGVLRDPQDAEDCCSAVTELLWRRLGDYDPARGSLTALARNTALNHLKAQLRRERRRRRRSTATPPRTHCSAKSRRSGCRGPSPASARQTGNSSTAATTICSP